MSINLKRLGKIINQIGYDFDFDSNTRSFDIKLSGFENYVNSLGEDILSISLWVGDDNIIASSILDYLPNNDNLNTIFQVFGMLNDYIPEVVFSMPKTKRGFKIFVQYNIYLGGADANLDQVDMLIHKLVHKVEICHTSIVKATKGIVDISEVENKSNLGTEKIVNKQDILTSATEDELLEALKKFSK